MDRQTRDTLGKWQMILAKKAQKFNGEYLTCSGGGRTFCCSRWCLSAATTTVQGGQLFGIILRFMGSK